MEYTDKEWMELANRARELDALYRPETKRKILELEIKALSLEIKELWDIRRVSTDKTIYELADASALLLIHERSPLIEEYINLGGDQ